MVSRRTFIIIAGLQSAPLSSATLGNILVVMVVCTALHIVVTSPSELVHSMLLDWLTFLYLEDAGEQLSYF